MAYLAPGDRTASNASFHSDITPRVTLHAHVALSEAMRERTFLPCLADRAEAPEIRLGVTKIVGYLSSGSPRLEGNPPRRKLYGSPIRPVTGFRRGDAAG